MKTLILISFLLIIVSRIVFKPDLSPANYTARVFSHFERFHCAHSGICGTSKSLSYLQKKWPHIYNLGFSILENDQK